MSHMLAAVAADPNRSRGPQPQKDWGSLLHGKLEAAMQVNCALQLQLETFSLGVL